MGKDDGRKLDLFKPVREYLEQIIDGDPQVRGDIGIIISPEEVEGAQFLLVSLNYVETVLDANKQKPEQLTTESLEEDEKAKDRSNHVNHNIEETVKDQADRIIHDISSSATYKDDQKTENVCPKPSKPVQPRKPVTRYRKPRSNCRNQAELIDVTYFSGVVRDVYTNELSDKIPEFDSKIDKLVENFCLNYRRDKEIDSYLEDDGKPVTDHKVKENKYQLLRNRISRIIRSPSTADVEVFNITDIQEMLGLDHDKFKKYKQDHPEIDHHMINGTRDKAAIFGLSLDYADKLLQDF